MLINISNFAYILTERVHTRQKFGEMAKSRNFFKLGWVDPLMEWVDHDEYFWAAPTLMGVAGPP